jgi:hypothetical protein
MDRSRVCGALIAASLLLCGWSASAQRLPSPPATPPTKFEVQAKPIEAFDPREPQRRQFGNLIFRGGLELSSSHKQFGGLSGLRVSDNGNFLAVTDKADWIRGRIVYRDDAPVGIAGAEIAPMLYADGRPITARGWYDTEALAEDGGFVYVSIERVHRILKFDYGKRGLMARATLVPGAVLEGTVLISSDMGFQIDNMEGLSVHRSASGETVLTLVTDDNFSIIQRTILLQFTLLDR